MDAYIICMLDVNQQKVKIFSVILNYKNRALKIGEKTKRNHYKSFKSVISEEGYNELFKWTLQELKVDPIELSLAGKEIINDVIDQLFK